MLNNRVLVQRVPYNSGGAVSGPITTQDSVLTLSGGGATVNLQHSNADETFTITVLPPSGGPPPAGGQQIVGGQSGRCLDAPASTNGTKIILWTCNGGAHQQWSQRS